MTRRLTFTLALLLLTSLFSLGCSTETQLIPTDPAAPGALDPRRVQSTTISFATRYIAAITDLYDQIYKDLPNSDARMLALQCKISACRGALGNAVNTNPVLGLVDMTLMVTLTTNTTHEPWVLENFGAANTEKIRAALKSQETVIWALAADTFTPDQIAELHALADRWRAEHPGLRYVGGARLTDFTEAKQTATTIKVANSIFNLVRPDPFAGLDPAVRQVEESRVLAERMFFYLQYTPLLLSWQADLLYEQMLTQTLLQPKIAKLLQDTSIVSASTKNFTDASSRFADHTGAFAQTIENFRTDLPKQQAILVKQVDDLLARQREAALKQVTTDLDHLIATQRQAALDQANAQITAQRDAAIQQFNTAAKTQQDLVAKNLQTIMDASIDRLYLRAVTVILIAALALLAVLITYRVISTALARKYPRPH